MQIVAIITGLLAGLLISKRCVDLGLILSYHRKYRDKDAYLALYDIMDDDYGFKVVRTHKTTLKTYADYLKLHQQARGMAYEIFQRYKRDVIKFLVWHVVILLIVPSLLWWRNWVYFLAAAIIVIASYAVYKLFVKNHRVDFYARLMMSTVLTEFITTDLKR